MCFYVSLPFCSLVVQVGFEVLVVATVKNTIFLDISEYSLIEVHQDFRGILLNFYQTTKH
jgi:hypothetical protein